MFRLVAEPPPVGEVPLWVQPEWEKRFPWLIQGTTGEGDPADPFDLGAYGAVPTGDLMGRWRSMLQATGMRTVVHARQVHEAEVAEWMEPLPSGLIHVDSFDAHVTDREGLLLAVSVADCVPVFLVSETSRIIGVAHAGWRGVAAGIVERLVRRIGAAEGVPRQSLWLHCGPAICGICYEVGPEVHESVNPNAEPPSRPTPIDIRRSIAERAAEVGVAPHQITVSRHCTRCGPGGFFSHRAGSPKRQMGVLGRRS
ncbi:MAG: polyphenol oxidase family protein [Gemmatimonadota bacterium]